MSHVETWDTPFEALPADSDQAKEGAERIRDDKVAVRERIALEHYLIPGSNNDRHGVHAFKPTTITTDPGPSSDLVTYYLCDPSGAAFDFTLIEATTSGLDGKIYILENTDTTNDVTIKCQVSDLINGTVDDTFTLSPGMSIFIILDETNSDWKIYVYTDPLLTTGTAGKFLKAKGSGNASVWDIAPSSGFMNVGANFSNLIVQQISTSTIDLDADSGVAYSSGGIAVRIGAVNLTLNISTTGENGRDVVENGGAEKSITMYHLWIIMKEDGTLASFATLVSTFPSDLPTDYIYAVYAGCAYNDPSGNLTAFYQVGAHGEWLDELKIVFSSTGATTNAWTSAGIANSMDRIFPPTAKRISVVMYGNSNVIGISPRSDGYSGKYLVGTKSTGTTDFGIFTYARTHFANFTIRYPASRVIYYYTSLATLDIVGWGWKF